MHQKGLLDVDKFWEEFSSARQIIVNENKITSCTPEAAAEYILPFSSFPDTKPRNGFCFYDLDKPLETRVDIVKRISENLDGVLQPLTKKQRESLYQTLTLLKQIGIPISPCKVHITDIFTKKSTLSPIIFYSFSDTLNPKYAAALLKVFYSDELTLNFIGLNVTVDRKVNLLNKFGGLLGLGNFPPNFGSFPSACVAQFAGNMSIMLDKMQREKCAVELNQTVMFCTSSYSKEDISELSLIDKSLFLTQYGKLIGRTVVLPRSNLQTKPKNTISNSLYKGATLGFIQGLISIIQFHLIIKWPSSNIVKIVAEQLNYGVYFCWQLHEIRNQNPEQNFMTHVLEAGTHVVIVAVIDFFLKKVAHHLSNMANSNKSDSFLLIKNGLKSIVLHLHTFSFCVQVGVSFINNVKSPKVLSSLTGCISGLLTKRLTEKICSFATNFLFMSPSMKLQKESLNVGAHLKPN